MLRFQNKVKFNSGTLEEKLKVGFYLLEEDLSGPYLTQIATPDYIELLGENNQYEKIALSHIEKINKGCGFIFSGNSGMGKTQLMKNIGVKLQIPVIYVTSVVEPDTLIKVVENINSDVIFIFDEFEKVYKGNTEILLPFFDGVETSNKVYNFVAFNDEEVSPYILNRPGRFVFNFRFDCLTTDEAFQIFGDVPEEYSQRLYEFLDRINSLSYDIIFKIKNIVGLHGYENFKDISSVLNIETFEWEYHIEYVQIIEDKEHRKSKPLTLSRFYLEDVHLKTKNDKELIGEVYLDLGKKLEECVESFSEFTDFSPYYNGMSKIDYPIKFRIYKQKPYQSKAFKLIF